MNIATGRNALLFQIVAAVAPLVLIQVAKVTLGSAPAVASAPTKAGAGNTELPIPVLQTFKFTPEQQRALDWLRDRRNETISGSPLHHVIAPKVASAGPVETASPEPEAPPIPELPDLSLTGVLRTDKGSMAMISGRTYRAGEEVAPGWKITQIDGRNLIVQLSHAESERTATLRPRR